jgi:hypothetical protein
VDDDWDETLDGGALRIFKNNKSKKNYAGGHLFFDICGVVIIDRPGSVTTIHLSRRNRSNITKHGLAKTNGRSYRPGITHGIGYVENSATV